jgi:ADP-heptose:LPS heptosyltransferase
VGLPAKVSVLQKADQWLFAPLCFLLTLMRRVCDVISPPRLVDPPRRILFVKLAEQGSTVLAVDAIRRAVALVGREQVFFAVFEENRFILDVLGLIPPENVFTVSTRSLSGMALAALRLIRQMRLARFDTAIDLEFFARFSVALTYLSGAPRRAGLHPFGAGPYRGDLMTHRVPFNPQLHTSRLFDTITASITYPPNSFPPFDFQPPATSPATPSFQPSAAETSAMEQLLLACAGEKRPRPLILLNPNASDYIPLRRWPVASYQALAQRILAECPGACVAFTGLAAEAPACETLARALNHPRAFSLAGKTSLRDLLTLYTLADILVTNDSGPAHFATLTPVHCVTLFGPETPALFAAVSPRNHVLCAGIACSPCVNAFNNRQTSCTNNLCMQQIPVTAVFQQVQEILAGLAPSSTVP